MNLHLIRHGMTEANEKRLFCGFTDLSLSHKGVLQLMDLKKHIAYPSGQLFVTSGLKRTVETLRLIYDEVDFVQLEDFMEINFGTFEMKSHEELANTEAYNKWLENPEKASCPEGEGGSDFRKRIYAGCAKLKALALDKGVSDLVLICHGGVIVELMEKFFPRQKSFLEWQPSFGRGYSISNLFQEEEHGLGII